MVFLQLDVGGSDTVMPPSVLYEHVAEGLAKIYLPSILLVSDLSPARKNNPPIMVKPTKNVAGIALPLRTSLRLVFPLRK